MAESDEVKVKRHVTGILTFEKESLIGRFFNWAKIETTAAKELLASHQISLSAILNEKERLTMRPFNMCEFNSENGCYIFLRIHKDVDELYLNGLCKTLNEEFEKLDTTEARLQAYKAKVSAFEDILMPKCRIKKRTVDWEYFQDTDFSSENFSSQLNPYEGESAAAFLEEQMLPQQGQFDSWYDQQEKEMSDLLFPYPPKKVIPPSQQELQQVKTLTDLNSNVANKSQSVLNDEVKAKLKIEVSNAINIVENTIENSVTLDESAVPQESKDVLSSFEILNVPGGIPVAYFDERGQLVTSTDMEGETKSTIANLELTVQALVVNQDQTKKELEKIQQERVVWQQEKEELRKEIANAKQLIEACKNKQPLEKTINSNVITIDNTLLALKTLDDYLPIERFDKNSVRLINSPEFQFALMYITLKKVALNDDPARESTWPRAFFQDTFSPRILAFSCVGGKSNKSNPRWFITKFMPAITNLFKVLREHFGGNFTDNTKCRIFQNRKNALQEKRTRIYREIEDAHKDERIQALCKYRFHEKYFEEHEWFFRFCGEVRKKALLKEGNYTPEELAFPHGENCINNKPNQIFGYCRSQPLTDETVTRLINILRSGGFNDANIFQRSGARIALALPTPVPVKKRKRKADEEDDDLDSFDDDSTNLNLSKPITPNKKGFQKGFSKKKKKINDITEVIDDKTVSEKLSAAVKEALDTTMLF